MQDNMIVTRYPKRFCFNFGLPKNIDKDFKYETEFIIKGNESLADNKAIKKLNNYY